MRGKAEESYTSVQESRITPAYAGKSSCRRKESRGSKDHPRLCGEKLLSSVPVDLVSGSPPPMRGKGFFDRFDFGRRRITPAYAGKSEITNEGSSIRRDHPRLCGEKQLIAKTAEFLEGSPPPMRGKVYLDQNAEPPAGITPAYAGKSRKRRRAAGRPEDHPRLCGEKEWSE